MFPPGAGPACRCCGALLTEEVADLGLVPISPDPVRQETAWRSVVCAPLQALVCTDCRLVQVAEVGVPARDTPLQPGDGFAMRIAAQLRLGPATPVAAFDPAALTPFRDRQIPAQAVPTGATTALRLRAMLPPPVLLLAGTALATAPDLQDAVAGVRELLAPGGVAVFDLPDLLARLQGNRFDLLDHALPAWPSVLVAEMLLGQHGLVAFDLEHQPGPGPWLRLLVRHAEDSSKPITDRIMGSRGAEREAGLEGSAIYRRFATGVAEARLALLDLLVAARRDGRIVAGYGAGSAAATLAAGCGLTPGLVPFTVHPAAGRAGLLLPGSRLPVVPPAELDRVQPGILIVLDGTPPEEVRAILARETAWQGRLAVPLPTIEFR